MPELWEKSADGVNRKLRELWEKDPNNVNRKLRELWTKDGSGVNRRIFLSGIPNSLGSPYFGAPIGDSGYMYNIHSIQNGCWQAGFGANQFANCSEVWGGGYLSLHIPDDMVAPFKFSISTSGISYHCENPHGSVKIDLRIGAYDSSGKPLIEWLFDAGDWDSSNTFSAYYVSPVTLNSLPSDRIIMIEMYMQCLLPGYTVYWNANEKLYLQIQSGGLTINNLPVIF